jgi:hypothetical protein
MYCTENITGKAETTCPVSSNVRGKIPKLKEDFGKITMITI